MTMKTIKYFLVIASLLISALSAVGQDAQVYQLNSSMNGDTLVIPSEGAFLTDDNGYDGDAYSLDSTFSVTITNPNCIAPYVLSLLFQVFDINERDTLYIYDGGTVNAPLIIAANNTHNNLEFHQITPTSLNTSNTLTLKFVSHSGPGRTENTNHGFNIAISCMVPCETPTPHIDSMYYKLVNGVIVDSAFFKPYTVTDTSIHVNTSGDTVITVNEELFTGVTLCVGQDLMLRGHGTYTHNYGYYYPNDMTTLFKWDMGNGRDTLYEIGAKNSCVAHYTDLDCYDVVLSMYDEMNCPSLISATVRVRIAQNPIKTLFKLNPICSTDSLLVNVGYEGENGTVTLKHITFEKLKTKTRECQTFIPDGPACTSVYGSECFSATVVFDDFPSGRKVNSKEDICSVCINYEHSFMGDYTLALKCPTGKTTYLKYKNKSDAPNGNAPEGSYGGGGMYTGYPYGGASDGTWDSGCQPNDNMYGVGKDYCFSRNSAYLLVDGEFANTMAASAAEYIANSGFADNVTYTFDVIPAPFTKAGQTCGTSTFNYKHPSNHEDKLDYYLPAEDFEALVGCPLNGAWEIQICDYWQVDNGWIFNWSMDICGISSGVGCEYQVGLDSVVWVADSTYGDWDLGYFRGLHMSKRDSVMTWISSPDTAGTFPIFVTIYDEFGCVWDSLTSITTTWTPSPNLGEDVLICDVQQIPIDAKDRHTPTNNYTYMWEPFGQTSDTIMSRVYMGQSTLYTVEVTNTDSIYGTSCSTRDSIRVNVNKQPAPNFDPGIYPLEGCEPFTIHFQNTTDGGYSYRWIFGDGDSSSAESPTHTYATGQYGFKYYVTSEHGCQDSLIYEDLITVYSSPVARFSWDPVNPTVLHPQVTFQNMTIPQSSNNKYYWEIQYDRDNPISYHTLTDVNPSFEWTTDGEDISGSYIARLIAMTQNLGPSGNIVECRDTIENNILLVNDFLQFPNVVTPNGDGINDKFEIKNLIDGLGYPNNSLAIYDRWGKRVYYKENIASEDDFWDPAADNIPAGTYFWRFVGKGYLGDIQRNGVVEVLK